MIKQLILNNLVLVEATEVCFGPQFNVITGETGAGKTALMQAIELCLGARAESSLIRKGCERAFVEMHCEISPSTLLEEAGLDSTEGTLIIRREISREGKNRAFVNCRSVSLPFLQKLGEQLIEIIDQGAHHSLRRAETQRHLLDLYAETEEELAAFQKALEKEQQLEEELEKAKELLMKKEREEELLRFQVEEIESLDLKEGEEEALFEKYSLLANAQEIHLNLSTLTDGLSENLLPTLHRLQKLSDALAAKTAALSSTSVSLQEAYALLNDTLHSLFSFQDRLDIDPNTFAEAEKRLSAITRLKRKYGKSCAEIEAFYAKIKEELSLLETLEERLKGLEEEMEGAKKESDARAQALTEKRKEAAMRFQEELTFSLRTLNMPKAHVTIEVSLGQRHLHGDDAIQFWLQANSGESPALVKEHSSGGEVCRLLLSIKLILANRNNTPTLLFDEIDANVGGKTAALLGERLKELGRARQVLCITHFPQVASFADAHFAVEKQEREGRTLTSIQELTDGAKAEEMARMLGGNCLKNSV